MSETMTDTDMNDVAEPASTLRYYGVYFAGAVGLVGLVIAATQTGNLILTLGTFVLYAGWCMYYIAVKDPCRRQKLSESDNTLIQR